MGNSFNKPYAKIVQKFTLSRFENISLVYVFYPFKFEFLRRLLERSEDPNPSELDQSGDP